MTLSLQEKYTPIVLCAGFGTRLKPLTDFIPKVVCPLIDKPFAFYNIEKFFKAGFHTVHCNTHYLPEIVKTELIAACKFFGYDPYRIRFWHEEDILETGGGVARIFKELCKENTENKNKDLIVVSGDIVADFPLHQIIAQWENKKDDELALLCTKNMLKFRKDATYVNNNLTHVLGFGEKFLQQHSDKNLTAKVFTNHQIVSAKVVEPCSVEKKSSVDLFYRSIINAGNKIINFDYNESLYWFNIGTPQEYLECIKYFMNAKKIKTCINYSFVTPKNLDNMINLYLQNSLDTGIKNDSNKISIAFRQNKISPSQYVSMNEVFKITAEDDSIYFFI